MAQHNGKSARDSKKVSALTKLLDTAVELRGEAAVLRTVSNPQRCATFKDISEVRKVIGNSGKGLEGHGRLGWLENRLKELVPREKENKYAQHSKALDFQATLKIPEL